jgi:acetoin utilization deacetylase AcuC-like enzyme
LIIPPLSAIIRAMATGYVYHPIYLQHDTGRHVEVAARLEAIIAYLEKTGLKSKLTLIEPRPATVEEIALIHQKGYIKEIEETAARGALYAAGGVIRALEAVMAGEVANAFALVRPPGHHANAGSAQGFCLFNNLASAARYALDKYKLGRILIIDYDVHHGNGTQAAFYDNPRVMYISTHEYPFYPGTGRLDEVGSGEGRGTNLNIPLPAGCGDEEYIRVFEQIIVPATRRFKPQLILVSVGYDGHWADPLAMMRLSVGGYARLAQIIRGLAEELCEGRLALTLEGGYNLEALAASVKATFDVLLGNTGEDPLGAPPRHSAPPDIENLIAEIKKLHKL